MAGPRAAGGCDGAGPVGALVKDDLLRRARFCCILCRCLSSASVLAFASFPVDSSMDERSSTARFSKASITSSASLISARFDCIFCSISCSLALASMPLLSTRPSSSVIDFCICWISLSSCCTRPEAKSCWVWITFSRFSTARLFNSATWRRSSTAFIRDLESTRA